MSSKQRISTLFLGLCLLGMLGCGGRVEDTRASETNTNSPENIEGDESSTQLGDPGWKGMHRLNNREYNNTIRDLVGSTLNPADAFWQEESLGFDNVASSLGMSPGQFTLYYEAAEEIVADVFTDANLKNRFLTCESAAADPVCAEEIIRSFGLRAFRRPLLQDEVPVLLGVYQRAVGGGFNHSQAMEHVLTAFLVAPQFLYRIEFDDDPNDSRPHPVSQYELASRLSYFLWSTMPDQELLNLADTGALQGKELDRMIDQMIADPRSDSLVDAFAWQWLSLNDLEHHAVSPEFFPEWNESIRAAMLTEARDYVTQFVRGDASWSEFLTADTSSIQNELASFYGDDQQQRRGFLGLGAFLSVTSFANRTSPTKRGWWILSNLLCDPPPPPPPELSELMAELDNEPQPNTAPTENIRQRLEAVVSDAPCADCHSIIDPYGLTLENYDALGRFRATYENGDIVDASVSLPDGGTLNGLDTLNLNINQDERFINCTIEKAFIYSMGRGPTETDAAHVASIREKWGGADATFTDLVRALIYSTPFQKRRGEVGEFEPGN